MPQSDPSEISGASDFRVQLLFRGKPHANALIDAVRPDESRWSPIASKTDEQGIAILEGLTPGDWMVACTVIQRTQEGTWESEWASLYFEAGRP